MGWTIIEATCDIEGKDEQPCDFSGEADAEVYAEDGEVVWECPRCGWLHEQNY